VTRTRRVDGPSSDSDSRRPMKSGASKKNSRKNPLAAIVLAAGKGTRMHSSRSKVLHTALGVPLVCHAVDRARELGATPAVAVLGHQIEAVSAVLTARYGDAVRSTEQKEQRGTGHAARIGLASLKGFSGTVLILYGDTPLLTVATLRKLVAASEKKGALAILTAELENPKGYGRIVRHHSNPGDVRVVEDRDCTDEERSIREINAGMYAAPVEFLRKATAKLSPKNSQNELYLTDIVAHAARTVGAVTVLAASEEILGINDRRELVRAEKILQQRVHDTVMEHATLRDPDSTTIEADVIIEADVEIARGVALRGKTRIGAGARIGEGVILNNVIVGAGTEIKAYCVGENSVVGPDCKIGPFAHLRPGTDLGPSVHMGNFVETKNSKLGKGSKANHLAYIGDTDIGIGVNVGAGTITCNYNGYEKQRTIIEDGAFIGSDSQLVAPVRIGRQAIVAAGTTVTEDVPSRALAVSRTAQRHVPGYADRVAARYGKKLSDGKLG